MLIRSDDLAAYVEGKDQCDVNITSPSRGDQAAFTGRIKTRSYEDNQGIKRKAWEVEAAIVPLQQKIKCIAYLER